MHLERVKISMIIVYNQIISQQIFLSNTKNPTNLNNTLFRNL